MTICDTMADGHFGRRADMAMAFAEILNEEARELEAAGVDVIQFDEPAFNVFMDDVKEWGIAALERAARGLKCTTAVHICYGYGIEANLKWKETLGAEWRQYEEIFPAHQRLVDRPGLARMRQLARADLADRACCPTRSCWSARSTSRRTRSRRPSRSPPPSRQALKHADAERIQPCTNCGMAPLSRDVAVGKLKALGAGAELARTRHAAPHVAESG